MLALSFFKEKQKKGFPDTVKHIVVEFLGQTFANPIIKDTW